jgi:hypothetical protein
MREVELLLKRVPQEDLSSFVLTQGRENEEFGDELRSWLKRKYTLPQERDAAYYENLVNDVFNRTLVRTTSRAFRRNKEAMEKPLPMPMLLDEVEQEFRHGNGAGVVYVALAFFRNLVEDHDWNYYTTAFFCFNRDFDRAAELLLEVLRSADIPDNVRDSVLPELTRLRKRSFYKKNRTFALDPLLEQVAELAKS